MGCILSIYKNRYYNYQKLDLDGKYIYKFKKNNKYFICKKVNNIDKLLNEIRIIKFLESDKTIYLDSYKINKQKNFGYIYYDYIPGIALIDYISLVEYDFNNVDLIRLILYQMVLCIEHCHINNIAHLDIKLDNFICVNNDYRKIKLIDFGLSKVYNKNSNDLDYTRGTIPYEAPEILKLKYSLKSDIWSLACCLFGLITHHNLFPSDNFVMIMNNLKKSEYFKKMLNEIKNNFNTLFSELLFAMLKIEMKDRISIYEIKNILDRY